MQQFEREMAVGAFLDVTLGEWMEWLNSLDLDTVPDGLDPLLGNVVNDLQEQAEGNASAVEAGRAYIQSLAMMTDDNLLWAVTAVKGKNPLEA